MSIHVQPINDARSTRPRCARRWLVSALAAAVLCMGLISGTAHAKKSQIKKIEKTGIKAFDKIFDKAKKLDNKIRSANRKVRKSKGDLVKALGLSKGSTYTDAIRALHEKGKKHIQMVKSGTMPSLKASDAAPAEIKDGVKAVNSLLENIPSAINDLKGAATASQGLTAEAMKFPVRIHSELLSKGTSGMIATIFKGPKITRAVLSNLKTMKSIPVRAASTTKNLGEISNTVVNSFQ